MVSPFFKAVLARSGVIFLFSFFLFLPVRGQQGPADFDLVVLGATPGGIMAAVEAARHGKKCLLLERSDHIGGLPANGLGATDLSTRGAVGGLFKEFVTAVDDHYRNTYGLFSEQYRTSKQGYRFEPSVAEMVFTEMLEAEQGITLYKQYQFDSKPANVILEEGGIRAIRVTNRITGEKVFFSGRVFVDATYEGDLLAAAGVPFLVGREGREDHDEEYAGKVYKYWEGPVAGGSTFEGDQAIQAFNYRLCLTRDPNNRRPMEKPENYNREEYLSLVEDVLTGRHGGGEYFEFLQRTTEAERKELLKGAMSGPPEVPGVPKGISRILNLVDLPNGKTDANNQQRALISSDLPEENWAWPEASWEWRDRYAKRLKDYIQGLLWFSGNDPALPSWFREEVVPWGLAADEYTDNENFPRQVYVREGRRMKGVYFYTAHDALPVKENERPPLHPSSVTAGHYSIDSHGVRKREEGRAHLDGFISKRTLPFTVPYGVIVPQEVKNLLAPVPVSGSHLGFSVLRMEPTWMALGQAAGLAAVLSINRNTTVQKIPLKQLQLGLLEEGMVLLYYNDISPEDESFEAFQWMGLHGLFTEWSARPQQLVKDTEMMEASRLFEAHITGVNRDRITRADLAGAIYKSELKKSVQPQPGYR